MTVYLPYEKVKEFFDVLVKYKNEDGYVVCSINYAGSVVGLTASTAKTLPPKLEEMGCVKAYTTVREPNEGLSGQRAMKGGTRFTIIKITGDLTEEVYRNYLYEEVTVTVVRRRKRTAP